MFTKTDTVRVRPALKVHIPTQFFCRPKKWYQIFENEIRNVWNPHLTFLFVIDTKSLPAYGTAEKYSFWFNTQTNVSEYIETMKVTFSCQFNFKDYPFEQHVCPFNFGGENYDYTKAHFNDIQIMKEDGSHEKLVHSIKMKQNHLPFNVLIQPQNSFPSLYSIDGRNISVTGITFQISRNNIQQLIMEYFAPTGIFAFLALISYFIDPDVVPGRMGLLVTLFLISSNTYNSITKDIPHDRGFSYIEMWLIGTQGNILVALIEYAFLLAWKKCSSKPYAAKSSKVGK